MTPILEIQNLSKHFGGVKAINDFSLSVEPHQIYGLIGPNGAGKTTIFNTITGIYKPTAGSIKFEDKEISNKMPFQIAQSGIGRTFQNIRLFTNLSVIENVYIASQGMAKYNLFEAVTRMGNFGKAEKELTERAYNLLELLNLADIAKKQAGSLPYAHQRRLEIARSLALNPRLILLDEPAAGTNPDESMELVDFIREIHEKFNLTILMIEHHMDVVMNLCHYITVLNFGQVICHGTPDEVQKTPCVIEAYLGKED
ncbi:MAG: ABC transporter ATP-binding protein [Anaerolineae bacterium]|nr:ABC transporter ATP-binding protein [Anaerolineae bacterium]